MRKSIFILILMDIKMHLKSLTVKNFRSIEDIHVEFDKRVNVIVGPNAVGKTTILEAIRLAKALLAPRTQSESQQVLFSLGAASPHVPQLLMLEAIAGDISKKVEIHCKYKLVEDEIELIAQSLARIAASLVQSQSGQNFINPASQVAFFSSPNVKEAVKKAEEELQAYLSNVRNNGGYIKLSLAIDPGAGRIEGLDNAGAIFFAHVDRNNAPHVSSFSYFPADRALPAGETAVQLGAADISQQIESHNSQPHLKFSRLKNTIFNAVAMSDVDKKSLEAEFKRIFEGILPGRELKAVGINQYGQLIISIQDTESKRIFDIDRLSSGEKGIILTFLLLWRTIANHGTVLIDEPELHLNPSVCRDLLSFLVDSYVGEKDLQIIICTHSPEILAGALEIDDCSLYHLTSGTSLNKVLRQDQTDVIEALRCLGTSESEGLLYKATIHVEGVDDVELLKQGFGDLLRRYKLVDLGGRGEVEKHIKKLQALEKEGKTLTPRYFIFDRDEAPTELKSTKSVRVLQWQRRCLENYLIDVEAIGGILQEKEFTKSPLTSQGKAGPLLRDLAMTQLNQLAAKNVFSNYGYESPGIRSADLSGKDLQDVAKIIFSRLALIKDQICAIDESDWTAKFLEACTTERQKLEDLWSSNWQNECDGKTLFNDLQAKASLSVSSAKFKRRIMLQISQTPPRESWIAMRDQLTTLISGVVES
jgi:predicted ATP-dependent endonuclease of OLD family